MFSMNKNLFKIKIVYFLTFAGLSPLTAFGPTFAKQLGFSTSAIGFVYSISIVLSIVARLVSGYLADKFRILKALVISTIFVCSCSILLAALFPEPKLPKTFLTFGANSSIFEICFPIRDISSELILKNTSNDVDCEVYCKENIYSILFLKNTRTGSDSSSYLVYTNTFENKSDSICFSGFKNGKFPSENNADTKACSIRYNPEKESFTKELQQSLFWLFFGIFGLFTISNFIIAVFIDTICFQTLDNEEGEFGNQRMFASIGWGTAALFSGILTDYFSSGEGQKNYSPIFILAFTFLILSGVLLIFYRMPQIKVSTNIDFEILSKVLWNYKSFIFACWCFLTGVYSAVVWQYSFLILEEISNQDELNWNKSLQGIMVVVNTILGDVPTYYFFNNIMSKLGYIHCMTLTLLLNGARLLAYSLLSRPIWAVFIAILDGFTFGITYATIASYSNLISTPDSKTTIQATFNSIFDGIGTSFGGLCFGFIYNWYGGAFSFRLCSFIAFFNVCLHVLINRFLKKSSL